MLVAGEPFDLLERCGVPQRTGLTVNFDDINDANPGRMTATDGTTGARVDLFDLSNYLVNTAFYHVLDASPHRNTSGDTQQSAYANLGREFNGAIPLTIKVGFKRAAC